MRSPNGKNSKLWFLREVMWCILVQWLLGISMGYRLVNFTGACRQMLLLFCFFTFEQIQISSFPPASSLYWKLLEANRLLAVASYNRYESALISSESGREDEYDYFPRCWNIPVNGISRGLAGNSTTPTPTFSPPRAPVQLNNVKCSGLLPHV